MQPEQPGSSTPNPNIPDYLGMEPIPDPEIASRKKNKITKIFTIFFTVSLVFILSVGGLIWWLEHNSAENKLYRAIHNSMQHEYIERDYVLKFESEFVKVSKRFMVESDFSNLTMPKSKYTHEMSYDDGKGDNGTVTGQIISLGSSEVFGTLQESDANQDLIQPEKELWYRLKLPAADNNEQWFDQIFDSKSARTSLTSPLVFPIFGNYSMNDRQSLVDQLSSARVYSVTNVDKSGDYSIYSATIDADKAYDIYGKFAKKQKVQLIDKNEFLSVLNIDNKVKFWVEENENKISKLEYRVKSTLTTSEYDVAVDIEYPNKLTVGGPSEYKEFVDLVKESAVGP